MLPAGHREGMLRTGHDERHVPSRQRIIVPGHVSCVGHRLACSAHSPPGQRTALRGQASFETASHWSAATLQAPSGQRTGRVLGQVDLLEHREMLERHSPPGQRTEADGGQLIGMLQDNTLVAHEPSGQRTGVEARLGSLLARALQSPRERHN